MVATILTQLQKNILKFFGQDDFGQNFYWTGGTLLSYYYFKHRLSADLDFFSHNLFADEQYLEFINRLKKEIRAQKITLTLQHNRHLYLIDRGDEAIKLEIVFFPFPTINKISLLPEFNLKVDSLADIMVNKTLSTYQRYEVKDIYDLYFYLINQPKYNLDQLIKLVEKKFGVAIEPTLLLAKINELSDNLQSLQPFLLNPDPNMTKKIKNFFQQIFNSLAKKQIK